MSSSRINDQLTFNEVDTSSMMCELIEALNVDLLRNVGNFVTNVHQQLHQRYDDQRLMLLK